MMFAKKIRPQNIDICLNYDDKFLGRNYKNLEISKSCTLFEIVSPFMCSKIFIIKSEPKQLNMFGHNSSF